MSELRVSDFYKPFPRQAEFHESNAKYRLFGGAAGPGKTKALLWEAIFQANHYAGVHTLLLRRTFPELEESLLREFRQVPRELYGGNYNETKHVVTWPNGSTTRFGHCQNETDVYQYQGAEYLFIGIDELTMFTLKMWQYLTSRNRCPIAGTLPNMAGATNPGNIGHAWVKAFWIDKKPADSMEESFRYNPSEYEFIRARITDNPIYASDASYLATLNALPKQLREAFLEGNWEIFAGQYFDVFTDASTVENPEIKPWWQKWISADWGFAHPSAVYWHAIDENERVITYRELHATGLGERELAEKIAAMNGTDKIESFFLSPDAFAKRTSQNTIAEEIGAVMHAHKLPYPAPADSDRIGGARLLHAMLKSGYGKISRSCVKLIECLPNLIHDEDNLEDVLKVDAGPGQLGDDCYDALRYGWKSMLGAKQKPYEVKLTEALDKAPTYTAKHLTHLRMDAEHAKQKVLLEKLFRRGRQRYSH